MLRYSDFGVTFGGPFYIPGVYNERKDKTFFFFSEEVRRVTTPVTGVSGGDPTTAMLSGNFTGPICTSIDANGNCLTQGQSIAQGNFNPIAAAYIKDIYS